jgi:hypothetical protein
MFLEAVSVSNILAFERGNQMLAVVAVGTAMVNRLIDPKAGLPPNVQVADHECPILILQVSLVFVMTTLTATTTRQRPGDFKTVAGAITLIRGDGHIRR